MSVNVIVNASQTLDEAPLSLVEQSTSAYLTLTDVLGYHDAGAPVAELLRRFYGLAPGYWVVASPMRWVATHCDGFITEAGELLTLATQNDEARQLFEAFADFSAPVAFELHYHQPTLWLMRLKAPFARLPLDSVYRLLNRSMAHVLAQLNADGLRFFTESQMFLTERAGDVNGVWFWGDALLETKQAHVIVAGDERWFEVLADAVSSCTLFDATQKPPAQAVLFVPDASWLKSVDLTAYLAHHAQHWHWDNMSYDKAPVPQWWQWRRWLRF